MPDLNALPVASSGDVSDDDLLLIFDNGAASNKSRQVTRANLLTGIARNGAAITPTSVASSGAITAPSGSIDSLTVATALVMGATVQRVLSVTGTLTLPTIANGAQGSATFTLTNAVVGDQVILQLPDTFPSGLLLSRAVVTGANTVTVYFWNASAGSITGAGYAVRATALRLS
jgi:hypothetical protein